MDISIVFVDCKQTTGIVVKCHAVVTLHIGKGQNVRNAVWVTLNLAG
jgi:hypothetical protein